MSVAPLQLGEGRGLFGILTLPETPERRKTALILLNAGMLHHIGPYGLHVDVASTLAKAGFPAVRIDLTGKGESAARSKLTPYDALLQDYDDVFAHLGTLGIEQVVLGGLCSGAADAVTIAAARSSVAGIVLTDGFAQRGIESIARYYGRRLRNPASWRNLVTRLGGGKPRRPEALPEPDYAALFRGGWPDWEQVQARYVSVLNRGAAMLCVFTRGLEWHYNREGQLAASLPPATDTSRLSEMLFPDTDHTFTPARHRAELVTAIETWMTRHFGDDA